MEPISKIRQQRAVQPIHTMFSTVQPGGRRILFNSAHTNCMKPFLLFAFTASLMAQDAGGIFRDAMSKMRQAGALAQRGDFGPANELITAAAEEMDRAVQLAPENVEFRARRGVAYSFQSYLPGKAQIALEDLKFATTSPNFSDLHDDLRQQAIRQLASLTTHPDRFPGIPDSTTPLVAVASFTLPAATGSIPEWVDATVKALNGYPGLLGTHAMSSVDHPGMFVVFTWWKDKKSLNDFFYGDLHQGWMRQRGLTMSRAASSRVPADQMPSQTAIEILAGLPGGSQINGGFIPQQVFDTLKNAK